MTATAKIFMNGRSQAVRLPQEFRFEGSEVYIRRDKKTGNVILSEKVNNWDEFFALAEASKDETKDYLKDREDTEAQQRDLWE